MVRNKKKKKKSKNDKSADGRSRREVTERGIHKGESRREGEVRK